MEEKGRATVVGAAGILILSTILSRILGYSRDIIIAATYGQGSVTDAYQAAFSIPDFLYNLLVGGAVSAAFIPVFSSYIATGRQKEGWETASTVFNIAAPAMLVAVLTAGALAPYIVERWLVPGFQPEYMALTVRMTRIMLIQAFFMALNGISMGILNSYQHFLAPAAAAVVYNIVIIFFGVVLGRRLGITGFAVGVAAGGAAQFLFQLAGLRRIGWKYQPILRLGHPGVRRIFVLMAPVVLSFTMTQVALFAQQNISSSLVGGSLSAVRLAQRLMQLPVGIFAVTAAMAVFPTLTGQAARGEMSLFKQSFSLGLRSIFFITVPAAAGLAALSGPIVRLLYQQGNFRPENTALTANTLTFFCVGLFAYGGIHLMNRVFYALQNTWIPVAVAAVAMALNIGLNVLLIGPLGTGGLALAYSAAGIANLTLLILLARFKIGPLGGRQLLASWGKTVGLSLVMAAAAYATAAGLERYLVDVTTKLGQALQVAGGGAAGVAVFFAGAAILRMEEIAMVKKLSRRRKQRGEGSEYKK
ncbi:MAG: murein biosynthesis integral membrane protein MurJ [Peptococcaceae bacterium]|jgi:putative peptidoglycan lipid II flippase|nr:murein biosynthesis integral membrane protein MurJ [Peptococcaceae bacterium]